MKTILGMIILSSAVYLHANQKVRHVEVEKDQIVKIKTAIGIATIIQVPDRPNSVVVGDSNSFKVEYLDQAITIKPVARGARSNLYIYTDWRRFNVELITGNDATADYVVYLDLPKRIVKKNPDRKSLIQWKNVDLIGAKKPLTVYITRLGTHSNYVFLEFRVQSKNRMKFKPEWVWITNGKNTIPIYNMALSSLDLSPWNELSGLIQLQSSDVLSLKSLRIEIRGKEKIVINLPSIKSWR